MDSTYDNLSRTDIIGGKIICTEIKNHKEQVINVYKVNGEKISNLSNFVKEVANNYGYDGREIERTLSKVYEEKNVLRYNSTSNKFESITNTYSNNRELDSKSIRIDRISIQRENRRNNRANSEELDQSSSFLSEEYDNKGRKLSQQQEKYFKDGLLYHK